MLPYFSISIAHILSAMPTYQRLHELNPIILRRIMRRRNHNANPFSLQRARPQRSNESHSGEDGIQNLAAGVSLMCM